MATEIKGLDSLMAKLNAMGGDVLEALGEAIYTTTLIAISDAQVNIHNVTGDLGRSIAQTSDINFTDDGVTAVVAANMPYAGYVEFGTTKMSARPYMKPAADAAKPVLEYTAKQQLRKAIRKAAK